MPEKSTSVRFAPLKIVPCSVAPAKLLPDRLPPITTALEKLAFVKLRPKSVGGTVNKPDGVELFNPVRTVPLKFADEKLML